MARGAACSTDSLYARLVGYLQEAHRVEVRVETVAASGARCAATTGKRRVLSLSEVLRRGSRNFQLAARSALLAQAATLDRIARDPTSPPTSPAPSAASRSPTTSRARC